jgi:hypothetical protein
LGYGFLTLGAGPFTWLFLYCRHFDQFDLKLYPAWFLQSPNDFYRSLNSVFDLHRGTTKVFREMIYSILYLLVLFSTPGNATNTSSFMLTEETLPPPLPAIVNEPLCRTCHVKEPIAPPPEFASSPNA